MELVKSTRAIKELIKLNDELENYFTNTIIPQLFVDADLILRKYTPPAMKQFRFTKNHIGKSIDELRDNIKYSTITDNIRQVIHSGEIFEKEIQTTDLRWFQMNIIPYIIQKTKKTNGVIITFIDITDRINDIKELEKLNAAHETFIYSVSHDLKGPLSNIEGLIRILTGLKYDKEQKGITTMLEKSVKAMKNIITELTEITKIEDGYIEHVEHVNFKTVLKETEHLLMDKIMESKAQIIIELKEPEIEFSRKNLRSILYNLLSNAIKYRSPDRVPKITIKTQKKEGYVTITVQDNGLGIAEDNKELIFSKFTRIEKKPEGTGIGLYLVKKIVDNAGGKIKVNSKIEEGSEFNIYLKQKN